MNHYSKTVVGLDVHKESIVTGLLPSWSDKVTESMRIENTPCAIEKMAKKLAERSPIEFVYEAGPCGYEIQRQLTILGYPCFVVAPGLIPVKACDRVKTDRRDAEKLARLWRAGELSLVRIPTLEEEASRDLVRAREDALQDRLRQRHRLLKFLLRQGRLNPGSRNWSVSHCAWLVSQKFPCPAMQQSF